jgi:hypothetical protein
MVVKFRNTICPPPPQLSLHTRAALSSNSNGTRSVYNRKNPKSSQYCEMSMGRSDLIACRPLNSMRRPSALVSISSLYSEMSIGRADLIACRPLNSMRRPSALVSMVPKLRQYLRLASAWPPTKIQIIYEYGKGVLSTYTSNLHFFLTDL